MEDNAKKVICPYCESDKVREYNHGQASVNSTQGEYIKANHISGDGNPKYRCDACGRDFGELEK